MQPTQVADGGGKRKGPALARSNDGCHRTRVCCPRCGVQWGTAESGLQPYEYTLLMQATTTTTN